MVIAPASTGTASSSRKAVIRIAQGKSGILNKVMPGARILKMVTMKLIAPRIEEIPAKCSEKIAISTDMPGCEAAVERGGYNVQPVPAPSPMTDDKSRRQKDGGRSQKLILFIRGKAMSGAPIMSGTAKLPKPPISAGMTKKNTMMSACAVTTTL